MVVWIVRAGEMGEQEQGALDLGVATIGWNQLPNLSLVQDKGDLKELYLKCSPGGKKLAVANMTAQIWTFCREIKKGDLVAIPLKTQKSDSIKQELSMSEFYKIIDIMIEDYQLKDILNGHDLINTSNSDSKLSSTP